MICRKHSMHTSFSGVDKTRSDVCRQNGGKFSDATERRRFRRLSSTCKIILRDFILFSRDNVKMAPHHSRGRGRIKQIEE
jgi:hypothetical protein